MKTEEPITLSSQASQPVSPWVDFSILGFVFLTLAGLSWAKGPDLLTDFGMQTYIPYQLLAGKKLYIDIAWKYGPLSQYFNAALFWLFGESLITLYVANLIILAGITYLIYKVFVEFTDRFTAVTVGCVFLSVFGMAQYVWMGNWNYVAPYVPEATHSVALSIALMFGMIQYHRVMHPKWLIMVGFCFGLICLTKIEAIVAVAGVIGAGLILIALTCDWKIQQSARAIAWLMAGIVVPLLIGICFLWSQMPLPIAIEGILSNLTLAMKSDMIQSPFYKKIMGTNNTSGNLLLMAQSFGWWVGAIGIGVGIEYVGRNHELNRPIINGGLLVGTGLIVWMLPVSWLSVWQPVGLMTGCLMGGALWVGFSQRQKKELWLKLFPCILWSIFSLGMLAKTALFSWAGVYGFIHTMPAALFLVGGLLSIGPVLIKANGLGNGDLFRSVMVSVVVVCVGFHLQWSVTYFQLKMYAFESGRNLIRTYPPEIDPQVGVFQLLKEDLAARVKPNQTLLMIPEGILFNYLLRRPNPTPFLALTPYDLVSFGGEKRTLHGIEAHPPDVIVLVHRPFPEWEYPFFGQDPKYGKLIMDWVKAHYTQVRVIGAEPGTSENFGVAIWELNQGSEVNPTQ